MVRKYKSARGITLVALVITIILLLILAGVAIATLGGDNGLITRAKQAKQNTADAQAKEKAQLEALEIQMDLQENGGICNSPNLKEGMIPVRWDGSKWVKADETNANNDWYDYNTTNKKWANVVTVKESGTKTREYYQNADANATVETEIPMEDITTMFVWIPRYAYKITSGYHTTANGTGNIDIKFLIGAIDTAVDGTENIQRNTSNTVNNYVVHPAFTANTDLGGSGDEIKGFWVGKFESSNSSAVEDNNWETTPTADNTLYGRGDNANVTIKPNVTSWRAIDLNNIFTVCQNMTASDNIHGLTNDTTTTMMQNSQWGAVAYLTQSEYGNKQVSTDSDSGVWNNSYNEGIKDKYVTLTGMAGTGLNDASSNLDRTNKVLNNDGLIEITYDNSGTAVTKTYYKYYTDNGQCASTTRNIYGIYDMSGGAWEYMASYLRNGTQLNYISNFNSKAVKYRTTYEGTGATSSEADRNSNYNENTEMYGDAIYETSTSGNGSTSWNGDYSCFPYAGSPFFVRGGYFYGGSSAGLFYFHHRQRWYLCRQWVPCGGTLIRDFVPFFPLIGRSKEKLIC